MRRKILRVTPEFIQNFLSGDHSLHYRVVADAIPANCKFLDARLDWSSNSIEILLESGSFEEVQPGQEPPALYPVFETTPCPSSQE